MEMHWQVVMTFGFEKIIGIPFRGYTVKVGDAEGLIWAVSGDVRVERQELTVTQWHALITVSSSAAVYDLIQKQRPACIWDCCDCASSAKGPMEALQLAGLVFWKQMGLWKYTGDAFANFSGACTQRMIPRIEIATPFAFKKIGLVDFLGLI